MKEPEIPKLTCEGCESRDHLIDVLAKRIDAFEAMRCQIEHLLFTEREKADAEARRAAQSTPQIVSLVKTMRARIDAR